MVFYNLFTFLSDAKAVSDVKALVLRLLEDEQLEVCELICALIIHPYITVCFIISED